MYTWKNFIAIGPLFIPINVYDPFVPYPWYVHGIMALQK